MASVAITDHAAARYVERVKPHLSLEQARSELLALVELAGRPSPTRPAWLHERHAGADLWIEIADGIALPVVNGFAVTVLERAGLSPGSRRHRNLLKRLSPKERRARWRPGAAVCAPSVKSLVDTPEEAVEPASDALSRSEAPP